MAKAENLQWADAKSRRGADAEGSQGAADAGGDASRLTGLSSRARRPFCCKTADRFDAASWCQAGLALQNVVWQACERRPLPKLRMAHCVQEVWPKQRGSALEGCPAWTAAQYKRCGIQRGVGFTTHQGAREGDGQASRNERQAQRIRQGGQGRCLQGRQG